MHNTFQRFKSGPYMSIEYQYDNKKYRLYEKNGYV